MTHMLQRVHYEGISWINNDLFVSLRVYSYVRYTAALKDADIRVTISLMMKKSSVCHYLI